MDFSVIQILLVAVVGFICGIDQFSFLESIYEPVVLGPIVGLILGNLELGIVVGAAYELMALGSMPVGGAQPPNKIIGVIMAVTFAISLHYTVDNFEAALGLAIPFSLLGQYAVTLTFTIMSPLMSKMDACAEKADVKGIENLNYFAMALLGGLFAIISVVGLVAGQAIGSTLSQFAADYSWVMAGLGAAGNLMKFVGFGILLKVMMSGDLWGFFFMGYAIAALFSNIQATAGASLLLATFIGLAVAINDYLINVKIKNVGDIAGGMSDGI